MSVLFETMQMRGMKPANRFVRSATYEGMATEEGESTAPLIALTDRLAKGGTGIIITSHSYIREDGRAGPLQVGIYKDELIPGLRRMTQAAHNHGSRIVVQINHAGLYAKGRLVGQRSLSPSDLEGVSDIPGKKMTAGQIQQVVESFVRAAVRAKEAGFDGVQIHAAHGYILGQFLTPFYNKRTDEYGGPIENRARFLLQVLRHIRDAVGDDFAVLVKLNSEDFQDEGLTLNDSIEAGVMLQENGIDAIEISGGTALSGKLRPSRKKINSEDREAYFRDASRAFKKRLHVPIILVGGVRSFGLAEQLVQDGTADYISMSRPLIREPALIKRWASGKTGKAACISCNKCFIPAMSGEGIYCMVEKKLKEGDRDK